MNNLFEEYGTTWYTGKEPQMKAFVEGENSDIHFTVI